MIQWAAWRSFGYAAFAAVTVTAQGVQTTAGSDPGVRQRSSTEIHANAGCSADLSPHLSTALDLFYSGQLEAAQASIRAGLETATKATDTDKLIPSCLLNVSGQIELQRGSAASAVNVFQQALDWKSGSPRLKALLVSNLATALFEKGDINAAETEAKRALNLIQASYSPEHPETLFAQSTLAAVHLRRGEAARAEPVLRRVLSTSDKTWGPRSYEASIAASNLAMAYLLQRQYAQALSLYERSIEALRGIPYRAKHDLALAEAALAFCYAGVGRLRWARDAVDRALVTTRADLRPNDPHVASVFVRLGAALLLIRDVETGSALFEEAIATTQKRKDPPDILIGIFDQYIQLLRQTKSNAKCREVEQRRKGIVQALAHD